MNLDNFNFTNISIDQDNGFITGFIDNHSFTVCLEQGKKKRFILAIDKDPLKNGSITGLAGESNCQFFERFQNSASLATKKLAKEANIKLV